MNKFLREEENINREKERDQALEIYVRDSSKLVEVWLTNSEKQNAELRERLKSLFQAYKEKNYLVAVFESGEQDLTEMTSSLLCDHRRRSAQREVKLERQSGMVMGM